MLYNDTFAMLFAVDIAIDIVIENHKMKRGPDVWNPRENSSWHM